jgi:signal transduction histidine kinase
MLYKGDINWCKNDSVYLIPRNFASIKLKLQISLFAIQWTNNTRLNVVCNNNNGTIFVKGVINTNNIIATWNNLIKFAKNIYIIFLKKIILLKSFFICIRITMNINQLYEIIDSIPQMIWKFDVDNKKILYSNKNWNSYTNNAIDIFDKNIIHQSDVFFINTRGFFSVKRRLKSMDGIYRWFLTQAIEKESGIWYGTCTDIEQVVVQELLKETEKETAIKARQIEKDIAETIRLTLFDKAKLLTNEKNDSEKIRINLAKGVERDRLTAEKIRNVLVDKAKLLENEKNDAEKTRLLLAEGAKILANEVVEKELEKEVAEKIRLILFEKAKILANEKNDAEKTRISLAKTVETDKNNAEKTRIELSQHAKVLANKALENEFEKELAETVRIKLSEYADILAINVLKKDVEKNLAEHTRIVLSNHAKVLAGEVLITNELLHQMQIDKLLVSESHDLQNKANMNTIAEISHEIRNPLNGVMGIVGLLEDSNLRPEIREYVNSLKEASSMLLSVVNDVLDISKLEAGKLEIEYRLYNPNDILNDIFIVYLSVIHSKGIKFINESHVNKSILGDSQKIKQILNNLISNAIKFTSHGTITIRTEIDNHFIYYHIIDTGIGISEEYMKKLFKPYSQADSSISRLYGGTGLGLSICQKLVNLMNGEIHVDSVAGSGSTFWIKIPLRS